MKTMPYLNVVRYSGVNRGSVLCARCCLVVFKFYIIHFTRQYLMCIIARQHTDL